MSTPLTQLDHYRLLGRSGLRVSPLCLGTMTFGTEWGWGADEDTSRAIFNAYVDKGGNFIDTANYYTGGTSERFVGKFVEGKRHQFVIATKFTLNMQPGDPNAGGNQRKNIVRAVEDSLRRLNTDYIDLYYLHIWENRTPIDEVMRALDDLVSMGKVVYLAISDTPAWKVAQANTLADLRGWAPFIGLQIEYSLIERTPERDLLPMALDLGLGVLPWAPIGGGVLSGKYNPTQEEHSEADDGKRRNVESRLTKRNLKIAETVQKIAVDVGRSPAQVAINWLMQQRGVVSPILGARKLSHIQDNLGALDFTLSPRQMERLNAVSAIDLGFPHEFMRRPYVNQLISGGAQIETR
jgi:aryl-alcohol dehydrogenase-like predicted oxidoreductase